MKTIILGALETRAAELETRASEATAKAQAAKAALIEGTGSAADFANAQAAAEALTDALGEANAQARAQRAEIAADREKAQRRQIEMQAVETAQSAAAHARELANAAQEANAALERFAALANVAKSAHATAETRFIAQAKDLTAADEFTDWNYPQKLGAVHSQLKALGAPETQAPNLRSITFGALLLQAMAQGAPARAFVPTSAAPTIAPMPNPQAAPSYPFVAPSDVPYPTR